MKQILLTNGGFSLIDDEDFDKVKGYQWRMKKNGRNFYAITQQFPNTLYMHRVILGETKQPIDHKNSNGLDNRKENLRICTYSLNAKNQRKRAGVFTSKYKGVAIQKGNKVNPWRARIKVNYKDYLIGYFPNEVDAAKAYDLKAKEFHGEFALLNFPESINEQVPEVTKEQYLKNISRYLNEHQIEFIRENASKYTAKEFAEMFCKNVTSIYKYIKPEAC